MICIVGTTLLCGCNATTRYQVLSFFFDGVPSPEDRSLQAGAQAGRPGAEKPASQVFKHGPFAAKLCAACHDSSTNVLLLPKDKLCFKCHELPSPRKQHGPVVTGGCVVCHDPHSSSNERLLVAPAREFCLYCHDGKEIYSREAHRGNDTACTVCHNPHGSDNDFFLR